MTTTERQHAVTASSLVKYSVFVGVALTRIFDCIPWIWGNLAVYVTSYLYARGDEYFDVLINWLVVLTMSSYSVGLLVGGCLGRTFGDIPVIFVTALMFNGGLFISYAAIDTSAIAVCIGFGAMSGFTTGVLQCNQMRILIRWTERYHGLVTSWVSSYNVVMSFFFNLAITWYINPNNLAPDSMAKGMAIFTQDELLNMVPLTFLQFFIWSTVLNSLGFLLLRDRPGSKNVFSETLSTITSMVMKIHKACKKSEENNVIIDENDSEIKPETECSNSTQHLDEACLEDDTAESGYFSIQPSSDITLLEVLKRKDFYALWIYAAIQQYAFFLESTYYKTFGLLHIPEDHFLTVVGMLNSVCAPIFSWLSGFSVDKFGVKPTMVVVMSFSGALGCVFYSTVFNKWSYLITCMLYGGTLCTVYSLTPPCCVRLYGQTYFTGILGMVLSSSFILTFAAPPLAGWLIANHGYFVLYLTTAVSGVFGLLALVWGLSENPV